MANHGSIEKTHCPESGGPVACPFLPLPPGTMSYRDLQKAAADPANGAGLLHHAARTYANYLWIRQQPARAILALCRAVYLNPSDLDPATRQPYEALVWMLRQYSGQGFLGNPRISFSRQATRMPPGRPLKRLRAWALWHLSHRSLPWLPPDPQVIEKAPAPCHLAYRLNGLGLSHEGDRFSEAMQTASRRPDQEPSGPDSGSPSREEGLSPE
ncbi:MAG: hypothetical protein R6V45_07440 [Oceanipulchritudo sp.]